MQRILRRGYGWLLALGLAAVLTGTGRGDALPDGAGAELKNPVTAEFAGLPNFVYTADPFNFSVRVVNRRKIEVKGTLEYVQGTARQTFPLLLPASGERMIQIPVKNGGVRGQMMWTTGEQLVVIPTVLAGPAARETASLTVKAADGAVIWEQKMEFRNCREPLDKLAVVRGGYQDPDGRRVVLFTSYEDEEALRKWSVLRWLAARWHAGSATHILYGPAWLNNAVTGACKAKGRPVPVCVQSPDPVEAILALDRVVPADTPTVLVLAPGYEEIHDRMPLLEFGRSLDALMDRYTARNSRLRVVLVTPPPAVAEEKASQEYAAVLRRLAREHRADLVDLQGDWLAEKDWTRLYAMDHDPLLLGRQPSPEGVAFALDRLLGEF